MAPRRLPVLHVVTTDQVLGSIGFAERAAGVLLAGGEHVALHLRGPGAGGRLLFELARELVPVADDVGALLLVNDRLDVALAAGAHGVQVGSRGLAAADARRLLGTERLLGCSVHSAGEAAEVAEAADFLLVGTLFATPSHPGRPGAGLELLETLSPFSLPMIGIGGITPERAATVRRAGGAGVAVVRAVWSADDPFGAVHRLVESWWNAQ
jgi:thiamine-phosphate diphosphorylase